MQLKSNLIKSLRLKKAWTQQHLADVCDLSLRTIQRLEQSGNASAETAMSLCVIFNIDLEELKLVPTKNEAEMQPVNLQSQILFITLSMFLGSIFGAIMMYAWIY